MDINSLVYAYLQEKHKDIAENFRKKTQAILPQSGCPRLADIYSHFTKTAPQSLKRKLPPAHVVKDKDGTDSSSDDSEDETPAKKPNLSAGKNTPIANTNAQKKLVTKDSSDDSESDSSSSEDKKAPQQMKATAKITPAGKNAPADAKKTFQPAKPGQKPPAKKDDKSSSDSSDSEEEMPTKGKQAVAQSPKKPLAVQKKADSSSSDSSDSEDEPKSKIVSKAVTPSKATPKPKQESSSDDSSDSEDEQPKKAVPKGQLKPQASVLVAQQKKASSSSSDSSDSDDDPKLKEIAKSFVKTPPKQTGKMQAGSATPRPGQAAKPLAVKRQSSSDSSDSDDNDTPGAKQTGKSVTASPLKPAGILAKGQAIKPGTKKKESSSSDSTDSEDEEPKKPSLKSISIQSKVMPGKPVQAAKAGTKKKESSSSSSSDSEEVSKKLPQKLSGLPLKGLTGKPKPIQMVKPGAKKEESSSSDSSDSEEELAKKATTPVKGGKPQVSPSKQAAKPVASKDSSSSSSDSDEEPAKKAMTPAKGGKPQVSPLKQAAKPVASKDSSSSSSDSDEEPAKKAMMPAKGGKPQVSPSKQAAKPVASKDSSSSSSDSEEEPPNKQQPAKNKLVSTPLKPAIKAVNKKDTSSSDSSSEEEPTPKKLSVQQSTKLLANKKTPAKTNASSSDDSSEDDSDSKPNGKQTAVQKKSQGLAAFKTSTPLPNLSKKPADDSSSGSDSDSSDDGNANAKGQKNVKPPPKSVNKSIPAKGSEDSDSEDEENATAKVANHVGKGNAGISIFTPQNKNFHGNQHQGQKRKGDQSFNRADQSFNNKKPFRNDWNDKSTGDWNNSGKKTNTPFRRVQSENVEVDERFQDNSFEGKSGSRGSWGERANNSLKNVRGRDFRHEKTKKKRGSYSGGAISTQVNSIKFDD